eukprot:9049492-Alexandrium_andersonii.AAC.1
MEKRIQRSALPSLHQTAMELANLRLACVDVRAREICIMFVARIVHPIPIARHSLSAIPNSCFFVVMFAPPLRHS